MCRQPPFFPGPTAPRPRLPTPLPKRGKWPRAAARPDPRRWLFPGATSHRQITPPERRPAAAGRTKPLCASGLPAPLPTPRSSSPTLSGKLRLPWPFPLLSPLTGTRVLLSRRPPSPNPLHFSDNAREGAPPSSPAAWRGKGLARGTLLSGGAERAGSGEQCLARRSDARATFARGSPAHLLARSFARFSSSSAQPRLGLRALLRPRPFRSPLAPRAALSIWGGGRSGFALCPWRGSPSPEPSSPSVCGENRKPLPAAGGWTTISTEKGGLLPCAPSQFSS